MPWEHTAAPSLLDTSGGVRAPRPVRESLVPESAALRYECRGAQVVEARGAYDMHTVGPLADALEAATGTHPKVVLDASQVTFADSAFLNLLLRTHRTGKLRVAAPSKQVRRLCEITGVDGVLRIRDTVDDAVDS
ncbi:STAS domain-containing protein [Streptomyces sp. NPDC003247]|uniref:STAS domain-containing protein n=1 Tax=Streptomyces sp. NPDC003247 TaxID=3364677 RepID=UPI0036BBB8FC